MSAVSDLLKELTEYHDETGDSRAGALVSVLYAADEHMQSDEHKRQDAARKEAQKAAAAADKDK